MDPPRHRSHLHGDRRDDHHGRALHRREHAGHLPVHRGARPEGTRADTAAVTITAPTLLQRVLKPVVGDAGAGGHSAFTVVGLVERWILRAAAGHLHGYRREDHHGRALHRREHPGPLSVIATQKGGTKSDTSQVTVVLPAPTATSFVLEPQVGHVACRPDPAVLDGREWSDGKVIRTRSLQRHRRHHHDQTVRTRRGQCSGRSWCCRVQLLPFGYRRGGGGAFVPRRRPPPHQLVLNSILPVAGAGRHPAVQRERSLVRRLDHVARPYLVGAGGPELQRGLHGGLDRGYLPGHRQLWRRG